MGGALLELLREYLQGRQMLVVHNEQQSSHQNIRAGVPQGSVLSPLLWSVYVSDMVHLVLSARALADDVSFAPQKAQLFVVTRSAHDIRFILGGAQFTPQ